jgi:hypothetical protein
MSNKNVTYKVVTHLAEVWILFALAMTLTSCSTTRQIKKCEKCLSLIDTTSKTIYKDSVTIKHDTVIKYITVEADTTIQVLVIECDSNGKATIKTSTKEKGNRSDLNTTLVDNVLNIKATCDKVIDSLQTVITNTLRTISKEEINTVFVPKLVEAKLTWWQKIKLNYGGYAIIAWIILILFFVGRKLLKQWLKMNVPLTGIKW